MSPFAEHVVETLAQKSSRRRARLRPVSRALDSAGRPRAALEALRRDYFLWTVLAVFAVLTLRAPERISDYASLVDWRTVEALAGMLVLTKGIERSGYLHRLGHRLIDRLSSERALALFLVTSAAVLSMAITNDVALFVLVPLTVSLRTIARVPVTRLVVFEALAVNAGSALTPFWLVFHAYSLPFLGVASALVYFTL